MNTIILEMLIQKYSYNTLTISLENWIFTSLFQLEPWSLLSSQKHWNCIVGNDCSKPLPPPAVMPSYQQTQQV